MAKTVVVTEKSIIKEFDIKEITKTNLALMKKQIGKVPETPENSEQYNTVKDMHIQAKKLPKKIEDRRVELKAPILEKGRLIDSTAKTVLSMVQPLIELSGDRRFAWEKIKEDEKAEAEYLKAWDAANIDNDFFDLKKTIAAGLKYNLSADDIFKNLEALNTYDISDSKFMNRADEAFEIMEKGLADNSTAYDARLKYEEDQAAATKLAEENAKKAKELEEKEAVLKAAQDEADKKAEAEAETLRLANKKLEDDKLALQKGKDDLAAEKKARLDKQKALNEFNRCHTEAIETHELYLAAIDDEIDTLIADADSRWKAGEKDRKEQLKKNKQYAKDIKADKKSLLSLHTALNEFIRDLKTPKFKTLSCKAHAGDCTNSLVEVRNSLARAIDNL